MITQEKLGIWRFSQRFPEINDTYHVSIGEGDTSIRLIDGIYFKCEYENPTGSVKDRGLAYQISKILSQGIKYAVISSSGNAAISAGTYCKKVGIDLTVFVAESINANKQDRITQLGIKIIKSKKPIRDAFLFSKKTGAYNLRQSMDPYGSVGFESISYEIDQELGIIDAIFIPVSSGTTFVGIAQGFQKLSSSPKFFAVQTEAVHPIGELFDKSFKVIKRSVADGIVAKYTPRRDEIVSLINASQASAFVVSDEEIKQASEWLETRGIICGYEGALALAGLWKARKNGYSLQKPVCLLTGKKY